MTPTALELHDISKHFGGTKALSHVDMTVGRGEIHALLGENGSGKSTMVKVLAGVHVPEAGSRLMVDGKEISFPMPPGAFRDFGLSFVHQDLGLAKSLTVMENLVGGDSDGEDISRWRIDWKSKVRKTREMLESYGVYLDPNSVINDLPPVGQALVAIARAAEELKQFRERTGATSSVLVLDEPTVFLPEDEVEFLFDLIRSVVASGSSVIFISHDLAAVREIADKVTVLRDGKLAATASMADVTDDEIVEFIVGPAVTRELLAQGKFSSGRGDFDRSPQVGFHVEGLQGGRIEELNLDVAPGEIVGLAGLLGSGAEDVPYLLFGATTAVSGRIRLNDNERLASKQHPAEAVGMGMSFIPADRHRDAIASGVSVAENMMLLVVPQFKQGGRLHMNRLRGRADSRAEEFDVRPRTTSVPIGTLSGGNAQKVVLAKWLETNPRVLLLHEPTQGVDVAARAQIYRTIVAATESGMSVVWVSSDFEELATVCDRVHIISSGRQTGSLPSEGLSPEVITTAVFAGAREAGFTEHGHGPLGDGGVTV